MHYGFTVLDKGNGLLSDSGPVNVGGHWDMLHYLGAIKESTLATLADCGIDRERAERLRGRATMILGEWSSKSDRDHGMIAQLAPGYSYRLDRHNDDDDCTCEW